MYSIGSWQKIFVDGSTEDGHDKKIARGEASWSKGRLDGIVEVNLSEGIVFCVLTVPNTKWHQFDRYVIPACEGTHTPTRIYRAVQAEVQEHHVGMFVVCQHANGRFFWAIVAHSKAPETDYCFNKPITEAQVGKWVTVVLPQRGSPFMSFAPRGRINDDK